MPKEGIWFGLRLKAALNLPANTALNTGFWAVLESS